MTDIAIRAAVLDDAAAIAAIYDHHARNGTATFDLEGHSAKTWCERIDTIRGRGWPFLVAEVGGRVVAFAYAAQFRDRLAYSHTAENSIYVAHDAVGQGVGKAILSALIDAAREAGFEQMIAVIGGAEPASAAVHAKCGFVERGRMHGVGRKFGRTLDTLYMQRSLL
jgi:L-amino acid N-acyltransferase YncA